MAIYIRTDAGEELLSDAFQRVALPSGGTMIDVGASLGDSPTVADYSGYYDPLGAASSAVAAHVAAADPHTQYHNNARGDARYDALGAAATATASAAAALASHEADTTAIHGIANTANLVLTSDARLSDARTPTAHAASHAPGGSDDISADYRSLANYDFTGGTATFEDFESGGGSVTTFTASGITTGSITLSGFGGIDVSLAEVPFLTGVSASQPTITNLDADKLDAQHGAYYLARANHTGTQAIGTITGIVPLAQGGTNADNSSQAINLVFASPGSGGAGAASWRALVPADIPSLAASKITSGQIALAQGGTAADNSSQTANKVFAAPDGSTGAASWRILAAGDIPSLDAAKIGTGTLLRARLAAEVAYEDEANVFTAAGNKFADLLRVGSQTAATGLVIGSQSAVLDAGTLTNNIGLTIYADSTSAPAALNYANPNVGAAAGLSQQFLMVTDTGSYKRALVIQVDKNNGGSGTAWLNSDATKQNVVYRLRMLKGGATADSFRIDSVGPNFAFGGVNSYGGGLGVIHVADRTTAPTSAPTGGFLMSSNAGVPTFRTSGNKIVNLDQGAAVSPASGGATIDAEARTAINAVITRLQDRGLLA